MTIKKILKNVSGETLQLLKRDVADQDIFDVPHHLWAELADNSDLQALILSEDVIVNNGDEDLPVDIAIEHLINGVTTTHSKVDIIPGICENAPELVVLNHASFGYKTQIGDRGYFSIHSDRMIGDSMDICISYCIDNNQSDKWISFNVYLLSTTLDQDKDVRNYDLSSKYGPFEAHNVPYEVKTRTISVPTNLWANNETTLFFGLERIDASDDGKDNPTNDPVIINICASYWKKIIG